MIAGAFFAANSAVDAGEMLVLTAQLVVRCTRYAEPVYET
jgi:hypothetical protein